MLDDVIDAICNVLSAAGINAAAQYPSAALVRDDAPMICVGIKNTKMLSPGCGDYLGMKTDENGNTSEVYGLRMELELGLDIYASYDQSDGASACLACFGEAVQALSQLPGGIRLKSLECGVPEPDSSSDMFKCRCGLKCTAYFMREEQEDTGEFTDFVLRGVLRDA